MNNGLHIAIIMDGNGRWAVRRGMPRVFGHKKGIERVEEMVRYAPDLGVRYLTLYAFSTENWKRPKQEIEFLFSSFKAYLINKRDELKKNGVALRVIGSRENLTEDLISVIVETEEFLKHGRRLLLSIAFNYGGRYEIIEAVRAAVLQGIRGITEEDFSNLLYTRNIPDPDLIIRTSGEQRLSNFLLWQSAYSEFYFTEVLWPDFTRGEFKKALEEYANRKRRFGAV